MHVAAYFGQTDAIDLLVLGNQIFHSLLSIYLYLDVFFSSTRDLLCQQALEASFTLQDPVTQQG